MSALPDYKEIISIILITTFGTFLLAYVSYTLLTGTEAPGADILNRWDVIRYLTVADNGYFSAVKNDPSLVAVFPLFPSLISLLSAFLKDSMLSALLITNIAFAIACVYLYKLAMLDCKKGAAVKAVLFFSIFPTSYFLHTGYTESLFLAFAISSFYYARKGNWFLASFLGMFSSFIRVAGVALFFGLLFEYFQQRRKLKNIKKEALLLLLVPIGFLFYVFLNYQIFGNPLEFVKNQSGYFYRDVAPFWEGLKHSFAEFSSPDPSRRLMVGYSESAAGLIGLFASLLAFKRLRPSYGIYMIVALLLVTTNSFWIGTPRYLLCLFPMFILMSKYSENKPWLGLLIVFFSLTLLAVFLSLFIQGNWAF